MGHFQSWVHFHHHYDKIVQVFAPSPADEHYLQSKYADLLEHPCTVAVHVRTFNQAVHDAGCLFLGLDYYEEAFKFFPDEALFVVFSDRINWCKQHLAHLAPHIVFMEGNTHVQDLILMSKMKHQIIANSTFSWWGAYLNQNPSKWVIAPKYWVHPKSFIWRPFPPTFYRPEWHILDFNVDLPYPEDIYFYDAQSQSIDTP